MDSIWSHEVPRTYTVISALETSLKVAEEINKIIKVFLSRNSTKISSLLWVTPLSNSENMGY
jgi:hypothetical protein